MSYDQSAPYYDAVYTSIKDYEQEAERLHELIAQFSHRAGSRLLDVACGTGLHDQYLAKWYEVEGLDLSEAQLAVARQRLPEQTFYHGDMVTFDLGQRYDVVTCLFSAIGHLTDRGRLQRAIAAMAQHLEPGGVLLVEPWLLPHMWQPGHIGASFVDLPELKVSRMSQTKREGNLIRLGLHHLIGTPEQVDYFVEQHELMMYTADEHLEAFHLAGLDAWYDPQGINSNGRGIFIGRKPAS